MLQFHKHVCTYRFHYAEMITRRQTTIFRLFVRAFFVLDITSHTSHYTKYVAFLQGNQLNDVVCWLVCISLLCYNTLNLGCFGYDESKERAIIIVWLILAFSVRFSCVTNNSLGFMYFILHHGLHLDFCAIEQIISQ